MQSNAIMNIGESFMDYTKDLAGYVDAAVNISI